MRLATCLRGLVLALAIGGASLPALAADPPLSPAQRQAVEEMIRQYILEHPEVVVESLQRMEERQRVAEEEQRRAALAASRSQLEREPADPVMGNPKGAVTLVEFFDYQCGYCKRLYPALLAVARPDGEVRLVMKEFPILGEASAVAARAALAAHRQGRYAAFHDALMQLRGQLAEPAIFQAAAEVGLDLKRLKADMEAPEIARAIEANHRLAEQLGIRGTPAMVIGDRLIPGAVSEQQLRQIIADAKG